MFLSKCAVCDSKKSKFIKEQEPSELLSNLRIKAPLSKISLVKFLFCFNSIKKINTRGKMNEIVDKFSLARDSHDRHIVLVDQLQNITKGSKHLKKHEIRDIFIKTN